MAYNEFILGLLRVASNQLYTDATTTLLMPSVRSLGPITMEQMAHAIPSLSYYVFMRRKIRS